MFTRTRAIQSNAIRHPVKVKTFDELLAKYGASMNRSATWKAAAQQAKNFSCKRFIETGCFRGTASDGYSTILLASLAKSLGGKLDSYELEQNNIQTAKSALIGYGLDRFVTFHCGDSVANLAKRVEPVDFAYLDSYDCGPGPDYLACQNHQLAECEAIFPILDKKAVILLDDLLDGGGGKPVLAMKRLKSRGFAEIAKGYQVLFSSSDTFAIPKTNFAVLCGHLESFVPLAVETVYHDKSQYALRHGYDLRVIRSLGKYADNKSHASGFSWARLDQMLRLVESGKYEWVWCVGADTLITNQAFKLEEIVAMAQTKEAESMPLPRCPVFPINIAPPQVIKWSKNGKDEFGRKHLIICGERVTPMQADSFLVRGSKEGADYLKDILSHYKSYRYHPWVENQTMIDLREKHAAITFNAPAHVMNSVDMSRFYHLHPAYRDNTDCFGNRMNWTKGDFLIHWPASSLQQRLEWLKIYKEKVIT